MFTLLTQAEANERLTVCHTCEHYIRLTGQCSLCYCFMNAKVWAKGAQCPINKW